MNVNKVITRNYGNKPKRTLGENEPKTNPIKANLLNAQMNVNKVLKKDYENMSNWAICENEPNFNPIQTQYEPNLSRRSLWRSRIKPNLNILPQRPTLSHAEGAILGRMAAKIAPVLMEKSLNAHYLSKSHIWVALCSITGQLAVDCSAVMPGIREKP